MWRKLYTLKKPQSFGLSTDNSKNLVIQYFVLHINMSMAFDNETWLQQSYRSFTTVQENNKRRLHGQASQHNRTVKRERLQLTWIDTEPLLVAGFLKMSRFQQRVAGSPPIIT